MAYQVWDGSTAAPPLPHITSHPTPLYQLSPHTAPALAPVASRNEDEETRAVGLTGGQHRDRPLTTQHCCFLMRCGAMLWHAMLRAIAAWCHGPREAVAR